MATQPITIATVASAFPRSCRTVSRHLAAYPRISARIGPNQKNQVTLKASDAIAKRLYLTTRGPAEGS